MIYWVIFGREKGEVLRLEGDVLEQYVARSLEEVEERVLEDMRKEGWPFAVVFTMNPEPVKLSLLSLEDETVKALGNLGAWVGV